MKRILAFLLLPVIFCSCMTVSASSDLMEGILPEQTEKISAESSDAASMADLALTLLRERDLDRENTLISPLSLFAALGMTVNGAAGETLAQMEAVLGIPTDRLNAVMAALPRDGEKTLHMANGIWFRNIDLTVSPDFLQTNANYYGAAVHQATMDDTTRQEINAFIEAQTSGMIRDMLEEGDIDHNTVMCLVNALTFEAEWAKMYEKHQVSTDKFSAADGTSVKAEFMYGDEKIYLEDENATGFVKYYKDRDYAFAAILPREGLSLSEYLAALDGESLVAMLGNPQSAAVQTALPKFSYDDTMNMSEALVNAGMKDAFDDSRADFSRMGQSHRGRIFMRFVLQKTFISVAERGTRAGAATVVSMADKSASIHPPKQVYLTRPFLYLIIDTQTNLPVFMGTVNNPS